MLWCNDVKDVATVIDVSHFRKHTLLVQIQDKLTGNLTD